MADTSATTPGDTSKNAELEINDLYDKVFKFCLNVSASVVIRFVNSVFDQQHDLNSKLALLNTETVDDTLQKRFADAIFRITETVGSSTRDYNYLVEFQTYSDSSMSFRIFEYAFRYAWENRRDEDGTTYVKLPRCAEIYLKNSRTLKDKATIVICDDDDKECFRFDYRIIKLFGRTLEENAAEFLLLLPFEALRLRESMRGSPSDEKAQALLDYVKLIREKLEENKNLGILSEVDCALLITALSSLFQEAYHSVPQYQKGGKFNVKAAEVEQYMIQMINIVKRTNTLTEEKEQLATKVSELTTENSQLATENSQLATEKSQLATEKSQLATKNSQLNTRVSDLEKELAEARAEIDRLKQANTPA